jgi:hypothetical protein
MCEVEVEVEGAGRVVEFNAASAGVMPGRSADSHHAAGLFHNG